MFSFSCIEQPMRCYFSNPDHDRRIGSNPDGGVYTTKNRQKWEEWEIIQIPNEDYFALKNVAHGHYLTSKRENNLSTSTEREDPETKWCIKPMPDTDKYTLFSAVNRQYLSCNKEQIRAFDKSKKEFSIEWKIEFLTGELCFINSSSCDKRISCNPTGKLSLTHKWKSWEIWRFIEAGQGNVLISSWKHPGRYLCSDPEGNVYTTDNAFGDWEKWSIEKNFDADTRGLVIKSRDHGRILETNGEKLITSQNQEVAGYHSVWCIETACSQTYFISSKDHDKRIGTGSSPFATTNRQEWEMWKITKSHKNEYTLYSVVHSKFLASLPSGSLYVTSAPYDWIIEGSPHGGYFLISKEHKRYLSCDTSGCLHTVSGNHGGWESWNLEPCIPQDFHVKNRNALLGVAGITALGLTVAMPFMAMGAIGAIGFTEGGVAAGSIAASMMSAEAIAAGGGVVAGGTVATLQSIGVVGLGVMGTTTAMATGAVAGTAFVGATYAAVGNDTETVDVQNQRSIASNKFRPFADWRDWPKQEVPSKQSQ